MNSHEHSRLCFRVDLDGQLRDKNGHRLHGPTLHGRGQLVRWMDHWHLAHDLIEFVRFGRVAAWEGQPELMPHVAVPAADVVAATDACTTAWELFGGRIVHRNTSLGRYVEGDALFGYLSPILTTPVRKRHPTVMALASDVAHLLNYDRWPWEEPCADEPPEWD